MGAWARGRDTITLLRFRGTCNSTVRQDRRACPTTARPWTAARVLHD